jgi:hypothetical protein
MQRHPAPDGFVWLPDAARQLGRDPAILRRLIGATFQVTAWNFQSPPW